MSRREQQLEQTAELKVSSLLMLVMKAGMVQRQTGVLEGWEWLRLDKAPLMPLEPHRTMELPAKKTAPPVLLTAVAVGVKNPWHHSVQTGHRHTE